MNNDTSQQLTTAIDAISVASAAAVAGPIGAAIGLTAVAAKSYIDVFAREHKLDDMMPEQLAIISIKSIRRST